MSETKDIDKPFHVICKAGGKETFHSGYATQGDADRGAGTANKAARDLGITAVYEARPRP